MNTTLRIQVKKYEDSIQNTEGQYEPFQREIYPKIIPSFVFMFMTY